ncbi:MAG TPA: hypothetical protein PKH33_17125 [bacterium]|nr:hypothetical protein [bacterium]
MSDKNNEKWNVLLALYIQTKELLIKAEELDVGHNTFIQTLQELKALLDHTMRIKAAELDISAVPNSADKTEYISMNLDKACGHAYRAFFDTADWFSIIIREKIIEILNPYSRTAIIAAIPSYYSEIRPNIDALSAEVANLRLKKDVANNQMLASVQKYAATIDEMFDAAMDMQRKIGALEEYKFKEKRSSIKYWAVYIGVTVFIGIACVVLGWILQTKIG